MLRIEHILEKMMELTERSESEEVSPGYAYRLSNEYMNIIRGAMQHAQYARMNKQSVKNYIFDCEMPTKSTRAT